jgi:glutaconate CoA-transferase subunit B
VALVTPLCLFTFDRAKHRFALASVHPGATLERVRDETGFDFDAPGKVPETIPPHNEWLALLRGRVARETADPYPKFAARIFGAAPAAA